MAGVALLAATLALGGVPFADAGKGDRGPRGPRGPEGFRGERGPAGDRGPAGQSAPGMLKQNIAINWQNGQWQGRDSQSFAIPEIGSGVVVCKPDTQWIRVFPYDLDADVAMWTVRVQRPSDRGGGDPNTDTDVRRAKRGYEDPPSFTGPDFNEGMNVNNGGDPFSTGTFIGQISSAGDHDSPGGPGTKTTTFQLTWHWNFSGGQANDRCYVAGSFLTRS
jgi:hypothetical protein